ncbi:MAG: RuvA, partial [uncultured Rubrobacteraceae bacterium]
DLQAQRDTGREGHRGRRRGRRGRGVPGIGLARDAAGVALARRGVRDPHAHGGAGGRDAPVRLRGQGGTLGVRRAHGREQGRAEARALGPVHHDAARGLGGGGEGGCDQARLRAGPRQEDGREAGAGAQGQGPRGLRPRADGLRQRRRWRPVYGGQGRARGARLQDRGGREGAQRRAAAGLGREVHKGGVTADREQAL